MPLKTYDFPLIKTSATGNDFLIADLIAPQAREIWQREFGGQNRQDLAKLWCDRYDGLGADGFVILEPKTGVDFSWDFYNSDGSSAEMCGNAARAVSLYASEKLARHELRFETKVGVIQSKVHSAEYIEVELPPVLEQEWGAEFSFVKPGVPHVVIRYPNLDDTHELTDRALAIKALDRFKKGGTNVTFIQILSDTHIRAKTFERGVEGFTKSCGTGAIAAAHSILRGTEGRPIQVDVPGGRLFVVWKHGKPVLRGPAKITGEMRWMRSDI